MRAIVLHEFGPAAHLRWQEVQDPEPAPGRHPSPSRPPPTPRSRSETGKVVRVP